MNLENIKKYQKLYRSSKRMGAARILRDYLGLDASFPIPLSIAHGVDMNQCVSAMDVNSIEPIHWSFNNSVHERALATKPSIRIPHPWLMLKVKRQTLNRGSGVLVIGPPPGYSNDLALLGCLKKLNLTSYHVLLKYRGEVDSSRNFWESNGVTVVSAGPDDDFFYDRLFEVIERYECVIGCTLSSALFFASSIKKECRVLEDYTYSAYEGVDYLEVTDFNSTVAREFVMLLKSENYVAASAMSLDLLGEDLIMQKHELKYQLISAMKALDEPVYSAAGGGKIGRKLVLLISKLLGRTALLNYGVFGYLRRRRVGSRVALMKINEIDVWTNGLNEKNFNIVEAPFVKNVTVPGWAAP